MLEDKTYGPIENRCKYNIHNIIIEFDYVVKDVDPLLNASKRNYKI